jgi:hypothetical protein
LYWHLSVYYLYDFIHPTPPIVASSHAAQLLLIH